MWMPVAVSVGARSGPGKAEHAAFIQPECEMLSTAQNVLKVSEALDSEGWCLRTQGQSSPAVSCRSRWGPPRAVPMVFVLCQVYQLGPGPSTGRGRILRVFRIVAVEGPGRRGMLPR